MSARMGSYFSLHALSSLQRPTHSGGGFSAKGGTRGAAERVSSRSAENTARLWGGGADTRRGWMASRSTVSTIRSAPRSWLPPRSSAVARARHAFAGEQRLRTVGLSRPLLCTRTRRQVRSQRAPQPRPCGEGSGSTAKVASEAEPSGSCSRQTALAQALSAVLPLPPPPVPPPSRSRTEASAPLAGRSRIVFSCHCRLCGGPLGGRSRSGGSSAALPTEGRPCGGEGISVPAALWTAWSQRCCSALVVQLSSTSPTRMQWGRPGSSTGAGSWSEMPPRAGSACSSSRMAGAWR
mmetsp:Transcript_2139/g.6445  ORF Transcript_2139/g.6445 Transcript_2139/m.6445 type:complete len:294 (+) Transcript_2139:550-1431(+)